MKLSVSTIKKKYECNEHYKYSSYSSCDCRAGLATWTRARTGRKGTSSPRVSPLCDDQEVPLSIKKIVKTLYKLFSSYNNRSQSTFPSCITSPYRPKSTFYQYSIWLLLLNSRSQSTSFPLLSTLREDQITFFYHILSFSTWHDTKAENNIKNKKQKYLFVAQKTWNR